MEWPYIEQAVSIFKATYAILSIQGTDASTDFGSGSLKNTALLNLLPCGKVERGGGLGKSSSEDNKKFEIHLFELQSVA